MRLMGQSDESPMDLPEGAENLRAWFFDEQEEKDFWLSWMTTEEAAALSGYDIQHIRHLAREGKIGAVKTATSWTLLAGLRRTRGILCTARGLNQ